MKASYAPAVSVTGPVGQATTADVQITVQRITDGAGNVTDWLLSHFPRRKGDTVIFFTPSGTPETAGKPRQVRWTMVGSDPGQRIVITAKNPVASAAADLMPQNEYLIDHEPNASSHSALSGKAANGPIKSLNQYAMEWDYSILLYASAADHLTDKMAQSEALCLAKIDPMIIITSDP